MLFRSIQPDQVETNIVLFDVMSSRRSPAEILADLKKEGVLVNAVGGTTFRAVTHLDVTSKDIEEAGQIFASVLSR